MYFVSVESLDSCHSRLLPDVELPVYILFQLNLLILVTVPDVELTVCILFQLNLLILVTVLHVEVTVCILFQLNLLILVTVLHVVLTLNQCVEEDKVRNIRYLFTPIDFYSLVCYLVVLGGLYREAG